MLVDYHCSSETGRAGFEELAVTGSVMFDDNGVDDEEDESPPSLLLCEAANATSQQFFTELMSCPDREQRIEFLRQKACGDDEILALMSLMEIGNSSDPDWLDWLQARARQETRLTVLTSVYGAIGKLGGLLRSDVEALLQSDDDRLRSVAVWVAECLPWNDAITLLRSALHSDRDGSLRRPAAVRLAYLGSDAGERELLSCLEDGRDFHSTTQAAAALCALRNDAGRQHLRQLLKSSAELSSLELTSLFGELDRLLTHLNRRPSFPSGSVSPADAWEATREAVLEWLDSE